MSQTEKESHAPANRTAAIGPHRAGPGRPLLLIAGSCVIESAEHCLRLADRIAAIAKRAASVSGAGSLAMFPGSHKRQWLFGQGDESPGSSYPC